MDKEQLLKNRFEELADTAYQRNIVTFSDFLDLQEQHIVHSMAWGAYGVAVELSGGYDLAERQMAAFLPDALCSDWTYPFVCTRIEPQALKLAEELNHRDFLGAILNLGLDRSRLGDLIVSERCSYLFCEEKIAVFLCKELRKVRHTTMSAHICEDAAEFFPPDRQEVVGSVASVRLDSMIALAFGGSRSCAVSLIKTGKVFVNGRLTVSNNHVLKEDDIVSARGKGKFQFGRVAHQTRKGRKMVVIYRYR